MQAVMFINIIMTFTNYQQVLLIIIYYYLCIYICVCVCVTYCTIC